LTYFPLQTNYFQKDRSNWHDWQLQNLAEDKSTGNAENKGDPDSKIPSISPYIRTMKYSKYFGGPMRGANVLWDI